MGRAILEGFKTEQEAEIYLRGIGTGLDFTNRNKEDFFIIDDRNYNGEWTVNID